MKKALSLVLSILMLLSIASVSVMAAESTAETSDENGMTFTMSTSDVGTDGKFQLTVTGSTTTKKVNLVQFELTFKADELQYDGYDEDQDPGFNRAYPTVSPNQMIDETDSNRAYVRFVCTNSSPILNTTTKSQFEAVFDFTALDSVKNGEKSGTIAMTPIKVTYEDGVTVESLKSDLTVNAGTASEPGPGPEPTPVEADNPEAATENGWFTFKMDASEVAEDGKFTVTVEGTTTQNVNLVQFELSFDNTLIKYNGYDEDQDAGFNRAYPTVSPSQMTDENDATKSYIRFVCTNSSPILNTTSKTTFSAVFDFEALSTAIDAKATARITMDPVKLTFADGTTLEALASVPSKNIPLFKEEPTPDEPEDSPIETVNLTGMISIPGASAENKNDKTNVYSADNDSRIDVTFKWNDADANTNIEFQRGKDYTLTVTVSAKDGYVFADDLKINVPSSLQLKFEKDGTSYVATRSFGAGLSAIRGGGIGVPLLVGRTMAGKQLPQPMTAEELKQADVNGNGFLDLDDIMILLLQLAGRW